MHAWEIQMGRMRLLEKQEKDSFRELDGRKRELSP
jgi:hypothetical protein